MKKKEFDLIEVYVYANHVNGLSECVINQNKNTNEKVLNFGEWTDLLSRKMLKTCEKKIKKKKLNSLSFLILKKELSSFKFYLDKEKNLSALSDLMQKYNYYETLLNNC